jgi:hypothetical protein
VLKTISEQRPPVNNDLPDPQATKVNTIFKEHPMNKDHLWKNVKFLGPEGGRCTQIWLYFILDVYFSFF